MELALSLAQSAEALDEVPVGAIIVKDDTIVSTGVNLKESKSDPTAHAEMIAIKKASEVLGSWRLINCEIYVTLEPCIMCAGAIFQSRFKRVVFGTDDPKGGALGSLYSIHDDSRINHNFPVQSGVLQSRCSHQLKDFFKKKRLKKPIKHQMP